MISIMFGNDTDVLDSWRFYETKALIMSAFFIKKTRNTQLNKKREKERKTLII